MKRTPALCAAVGLIAAFVKMGAAEPAAEKKLVVDWDAAPPLRTGALAGYAEVVKAAAPSVVAVLVELPPEAAAEAGWGRGRVGLLSGEPAVEGSEFETDSIGSGIILNTDGYILTSSHVVELAQQIRVLIPGREKAEPVRLIGIDPLTDIAVLKLDSVSALPAAKFARGPDLCVGDVVLTIGNPFGLEHTVTSGIVSALGRKNLGSRPFENLIQTDAPINRGSSGGALVDNRGRVVGITGAMVSEDGHNAGIGFAEPIESAVAVAEKLIAQGEIRRGYFGATFTPLSDSLAKVFGVASGRGAVISGVADGSPAERAKLNPGDVVLEFDSAIITGPAQLEILIAQGTPGAEIDVKFVRFGETFTRTLKLAATPGKKAGSAIVVSGEGILEGVVLAELDPGARFYFGVPPDISGVVVVQVDPASAAGRVGIDEGDVVMQIGRESVSSLGQAIAARERIDGQTILLRILGWQGIKFAVLEETDSSNK